MATKRAAFLFCTITLTLFAGARTIDHAQSNSKVVIAADVALVQVPVIVFDAQGAVAADLQQSDFRVVENGLEQRLLYFERERQSASFVILDDISQSMTNKISFVRDATASILDSLAPQDRYQDEYSLFGIESRVARMTPFVNDAKNLARRLAGLVVPTAGGTALFDGIYAGVMTAKQEAHNKRSAVIIISDGGDNHSRHSLRQTKQFLQEANVPVFAVMAGQEFKLLAPPQQVLRFGGVPIPIPVPDADYIGPAEQQGPRNLKTLTEVTGGGVFTARDSDSLTRIAHTISTAVRYQYLLSYEPQGTDHVKRKDAWHEIHIELIPRDKFKGYNIYYKRGYYRQ
jgi:Ca-activated chloride channel homolog